MMRLVIRFNVTSTHSDVSQNVVWIVPILLDEISQINQAFDCVDHVNKYRCRDGVWFAHAVRPSE
jgi:hypothetical protein